LLEGTAGTQVVLKIATDATGKDVHEVTVTPIADDLSLRNPGVDGGEPTQV